MAELVPKTQKTHFLQDKEQWLMVLR